MIRNWVIVTGDFAMHGGMDRANYELAAGVAARGGANVHLVAHRVEEPLASHPAVRFHPVARPLGSHWLAQPLLDLAGRRAAAESRAADPRTAVVVNGGNCLVPDSFNWVHMVHSACPRADRGAPLKFRAKNTLDRSRARRRETAALGRCRLAFANSERTARDLRNLLRVPESKIRVVRLGADPVMHAPASPEERAEARAALGLREDQPMVLFAGALGYDRNKGLDTLLRAWGAAVKGGLKDGMLYAAGGGVLHFWEPKIDLNEMRLHAKLTGPTRHLPELMAAADLFVAPSRYDAHGLAVQEAICRGVPAIASSAAGVSELFPPELSELILPDPDDAEDLTRRILRALERRAELAPAVVRMGERILANTWSVMAGRMIELAEESMSGGAGAPA